MLCNRILEMLNIECSNSFTTGSVRKVSQWPRCRVWNCGCMVANANKNCIGDENFKTIHQHATFLLSPRHLKFQGIRVFSKRNHKAPVDNCSKMKRGFYDLHIYPAPYTFSGFSQIRISQAKMSSSNKKVWDPGKSTLINVAFLFCFGEKQILNCTLSWI